MPTLIVTRGLPGSGKTTRAKAWVAEDPKHRARVNRDDFRAMLHGGWVDAELAVTTAEHAAISTLLSRGLDVVCDDTNLKSRHVRELRNLATLAGAAFEVWDMTDVDPDTCIARDALREGTACVGSEVIGDMHTRYVRGRPYPLPLADEADIHPEPAAVVPYKPVNGTAYAILVDIDGTVALRGTRSPYDETRVHEDRPNEAVIEVVRTMSDAGHQLVFCSGRTDACRAATEKWLWVHFGSAFDPAYLHMRAAGDKRKDSIVKAEIFDREIRHRWRVIGVFDDRGQVVRMWRALGLTVFQVADGNF